MTSPTVKALPHLQSPKQGDVNSLLALGITLGTTLCTMLTSLSGLRSVTSTLGSGLHYLCRPSDSDLVLCWH